MFVCIREKYILSRWRTVYYLFSLFVLISEIYERTSISQIFFLNCQHKYSPYVDIYFGQQSFQSWRMICGFFFCFVNLAF